MGLFKDFKEDFSQAVGELLPGSDEDELDEESGVDLVVDTFSEDVDVQSELSKLDGLLEDVDTIPEPKKPESVSEIEAEEPEEFDFPDLDDISMDEEEPKPVEKAPETQKAPFSGLESALTMPKFVTETPKNTAPIVEEKKKMNENLMMDAAKSAPDNMPASVGEIVDETTVVTESTTLTGDVASAGSLDIQGTINGNVACNGKLSVTGTINGNSSASEIFADVAKIEGEVVSSGTVKIGAGSVIVGNITAASAVVAGAVKGDIDVQGPVVVDTSAVIMGNIKSRSVQINNGAVIEGFCSQCYADIDVQGLFDNK